jgi:hypothetical protein
VVGNRLATNPFVVGEPRRSQYEIQSLDRDVLAWQRPDRWDRDPYAAAEWFVGGEEFAGEQGARDDGLASGGIEEHRQMPVPFRRSHDCDSGLLMQDLWTDL